MPVRPARPALLLNDLNARPCRTTRAPARKLISDTRRGGLLGPIMFSSSATSSGMSSPAVSGVAFRRRGCPMEGMHHGFAKMPMVGLPLIGRNNDEGLGLPSRGLFDRRGMWRRQPDTVGLEREDEWRSRN